MNSIISLSILVLFACIGLAFSYGGRQIGGWGGSSWGGYGGGYVRPTYVLAPGYGGFGGRSGGGFGGGIGGILGAILPLILLVVILPALLPTTTTG